MILSWDYLSSSHYLILINSAGSTLTGRLLASHRHHVGCKRTVQHLLDHQATVDPIRWKPFHMLGPRRAPLLHNYWCHKGTRDANLVHPLKLAAELLVESVCHELSLVEGVLQQGMWCGPRSFDKLVGKNILLMCRLHDKGCLMTIQQESMKSSYRFDKPAILPLVQRWNKMLKSLCKILQIYF